MDELPDHYFWVFLIKMGKVVIPNLSLGSGFKLGFKNLTNLFSFDRF